jgi:CelD/BcsL family acetyltransferase involved in cellulose biosynthesis
VTGLEALRALEPGLTRLHERCGASVTSSAPWVLGTVSASTTAHPWAVVVRDLDGDLRAALVLAAGPDDDPGGAWLAGSMLGHRSTILAVDADAAWALGRCVAEALETDLGAQWLEIGPVDPRWAHLSAFLAAAPDTNVRTLDPVPVIRRIPGLETKDYLSPGMRRTLRKAGNRIEADGRLRRTSFTRNGDQILARLPGLDEVHRDRDHVQGRTSELDDPWSRRVWFGRIRRLAEAGVLELATLQVDGVLAAYVLGVPDGDVYRVLEGHLATPYTRYSPGRVLETAVLARAFSDPRVQTLDWMTSRAPDRLLAANDAEPVVMLNLNRSGRAR